LWAFVASASDLARGSQGQHRALAFLLMTVMQELAKDVDADGLAAEWNEALNVRFASAVADVVATLRAPTSASRFVNAVITLTDAYYTVRRRQ
jgi:hypothetical protein